jgi:large subunit ribosomal protein L6
MSRIGKKPIALPAGVKYTVEGNTVLVEGPKGKVSASDRSWHQLVKDGNVLNIERESDKAAAFPWPDPRAGLQRGAWRDPGLDQGSGHRRHRLPRRVEGQGMVVFTLGYSHPIEFPLPTGIEVTIDPKQTHLDDLGIDRQKVGQVAADMRSLRKPDPYKNKGVRYTGEKLEEEGRQVGREVSRKAV